MFEFELEQPILAFLGAKVMFASLGMPKLSDIQWTDLECSLFSPPLQACTGNLLNMGSVVCKTTLPKSDVELEDNSTVSLT